MGRTSATTAPERVVCGFGYDCSLPNAASGTNRHVETPASKPKRPLASSPDAGLLGGGRTLAPKSPLRTECNLQRPRAVREVVAPLTRALHLGR